MASVNIISSTDLEPRMRVREAGYPPVLVKRLGLDHWRTVASAQLRGGWVQVRFTDGTGVDTRETSSWEVLG